MLRINKLEINEVSFFAFLARSLNIFIIFMTRMTRSFQPFYKEIYLVRGEWFFLRKSWNTRDTRVMVRMVGLAQLSDS